MGLLNNIHQVTVEFTVETHDSWGITLHLSWELRSVHYHAYAAAQENVMI